ncbi:M18 family aminopeptidase [Geofilum rubicundum]|uniref:M18 family aminopeptidase n=1 Tax=Geofilum rubicundum JCM 15548 TaxID=1236989 RepID=A0A0E9LVA5_9BACT|nr:M18 family aminopeptidase [Geofilum rubicundum]GAO28805.1 probable M18-family aminopeptidase 2 [Geofilum rubicundum JCM 15548]
MDQAHKLSQELIDFIYESASPFHAVDNLSMQLDKAGFEALDLTAAWQLTKGGKYYLTRNGSALFAFVLGTGQPEKEGVKIIAAHSDSPSFRIKPNPEMVVDDHFIKLNTEVYGGPILMSWLDRPLSIAGRVSLKGEHPLWPDNRLVNFNRPMVIIPSLAIHLNRSVNEGMELNKQKDMLPLMGLMPGKEDEKGFIKRLLAEELGVHDNDILDYDLTLNEFNPGLIMGAHHEFISSPKIDNLAMTHAGLKALLNSKPGAATQMLCIFDNEEVGSLTKQGADSPLFKNILQRLLSQLDVTGEDFHRTIYRSFMISADMAHSLHPNYPEKHDPNLHPLINKGPVIKITANQKYTSDGDSIAVFEAICEKAGVPCQKFVNRSDMVGGSTLGNLSTGQVDIRSVDVGNPMLAMHSVRELSGVLDHGYMIKAFETFYNL